MTCYANRSVEYLAKLKKYSRTHLEYEKESKLMVSRNNDFSLNKYVFGLVLVELIAKILNAQERCHKGHG